LYSEADPEKVVKSLPMFKWTEKVVKELMPLVFEKLDKVVLIKI